MSDIFEKPNASLKEQAYARIKRKIVTMEYSPGEYLNEAMICEQLGIGRTPVHQAVDQLSLEGLTDIIPRKGLIVRPISMDEVRDIIEVRLLNERYCVSLAAQNATNAHIEEMEEILDNAAGYIKDRNRERLMEADYQFHLVISSAANNRILADMLRVLHERQLRFWFVSLNDDEHPNDVQQEHTDILNAIKNHDGQAAADATQAHIESFRNAIMHSL
ncbi:MAG: GntR family transcriptional regulator [Alphaproteobacteria bacterium]